MNFSIEQLKEIIIDHWLPVDSLDNLGTWLGKNDYELVIQEFNGINLKLIERIDFVHMNIMIALKNLKKFHLAKINFVDKM